LAPLRNRAQHQVVILNAMIPRTIGHHLFIMTGNLRQAAPASASVYAHAVSTAQLNETLLG
jgi:hypothetical protein